MAEIKEKGLSIYKSLVRDVQLHLNENRVIYPYDLAEQLVELRDVDRELFHKTLSIVPADLLAEAVGEMSGKLQEDVAEFLGPIKMASVAEKMDTDEAADLIQNISENDEKAANEILENLEEDDREILTSLISYDESSAGAHMQAELFSSKLSEKISKSIEGLRKLKEDKAIDNLHHVFIVDDNNKYICSIALEEVIIMDFRKKFSDIIETSEDKEYFDLAVNHRQDIGDVVEMVSNYDLAAVPVVDDENRLIGRITSDDIYDIIEEQATEQIYGMAGVDEDSESDEVSIFTTARSRGLWLLINLFTAFMASMVIGVFDQTLQSTVALAILMPVVASMGGNAGNQSLTVTVRQLALGEIDLEDGLETIFKELRVSVINGFIFSLIVGVVSYLWFQMPLLGVVMGLAIIINLLVAGFFGVVIPLVLEKLKIDPAVASSVLLTTVTDMTGFFTFLGLAKLILGP